MSQDLYTFDTCSTRELLRVYLPRARRSGEPDFLAAVKKELATREHVPSKREGAQNRRNAALMHRKRKHPRKDKAVFQEMTIFRENIVGLKFCTKYTTVFVFARREENGETFWSVVEGSNVYAVRNDTLTFVSAPECLEKMQETPALQAVAQVLPKQQPFAIRFLDNIAKSNQEVAKFSSLGLHMYSDIKALDGENSYRNVGTWHGISLLRDISPVEETKWYFRLENVLFRALCPYLGGFPYKRSLPEIVDSVLFWIDNNFFFWFNKATRLDFIEKYQKEADVLLLLKQELLALQKDLSKVT